MANVPSPAAPVHCDTAPASSAWPPDSDTAFWDARVAFDDISEAAACYQTDRYEDEAPTDETPYLTDDDLARIDALIAHMKALSTEHAYRFGGFPPLPTDADDRTDYSDEIARRDAALERQLEESWEMDRYESGLSRYDRCDDDFRGCLAGHDASEGGDS